MLRNQPKYFFIKLLLLFALTRLGLDAAATSQKVVRQAFPSVLEDSPYYATSGFIPPNEHFNFLHYRALAHREFSSSTAVISVGTLRAFNLAAALRRDVLIAVDISFAVTMFNIRLAELIEAYSREDFVKLMLGLEPRQKLEDSREGFLGAIINPPADPSAELHALLRPARVHFVAWLASLKGYALNDQTWAGTFFSNDKSYYHLQKMVRERRFFAATASLSGESGLMQIADWLKASQITVAEVDASNALAYVLVYEEGLGRDRFIRNLQRLPLTSQSNILMTVRSTDYAELIKEDAVKDLGGLDNWTYLVRGVHSFLAKLHYVQSKPELLSYLYASGESTLEKCERSVE